MTQNESNDKDDVLGDILVPPFIIRKDEGIFVYLPKLKMAGEFEQFANRLFSAELFFRGLEYAAFHKLLYDDEWLYSVQSKNMELKLADDIKRFSPTRRALYHGVKLLEDGKAAEYMFEPVNLEITYQEPVCGEADASGVIPILEYRSKTRLQPDKLDFDEFIADMWLKEVRFGIDAETVRKNIASGVVQRSIIARRLDPTEGRDAEIKEVSSHLHRDNAPKMLATGKIDLRVFSNRFPQMAEGERMLQKIPRKLGKPGRKISGAIIEPGLPLDIDLSALASSGTRIEQAKDGEYIVAAINGFLVLDTHSNQVSITEKIENKGGISAKTTGNLDLSVDEFIEHGEVQEGRLVEGRNMTFLSAVFGQVMSHQGNIRIKSSLTGGKAVALNGNIEVNGKMSRSDARAHKGEIIGEFVESSTLLGKVVRVKHAVNCEIIAEELHAELLEGCSVAAKKISINATDERRGTETLVTVIIPDYAPIDQLIAGTMKQAAEIREKMTALLGAIQAIKADAEFSKFLALQSSINRGTINLNEEQEANRRKLAEKHAPSVLQISNLQSEASRLEQNLKKIEEERNVAEQHRETLGTGISCVITRIKGQTIGQTMKSSNGTEIFSLLPENDIKALLHKVDSSKSRIFVGESGTINWQFTPPESQGKPS